MQLNPLLFPQPGLPQLKKPVKENVREAAIDEGVLRGKFIAHGNFSEYVPIGLLFIIALELMQAPSAGLASWRNPYGW